MSTECFVVFTANAPLRVFQSLIEPMAKSPDAPLGMRCTSVRAVESGLVELTPARRIPQLDQLVKVHLHREHIACILELDKKREGLGFLSPE